jgi:hypothetical protein
LIFLILQLLAGATFVAAAPTEISDAQAYAELDQILKVHFLFSMYYLLVFYRHFE